MRKCVYGNAFRLALFALALLLLCLLTGLYCLDDYCQHRVRLNEVCANQDSSWQDGPLGDYIELYNPGSLPCRLSKLYLSDDYEDLQKLPLAGRTIPAKGYLVVDLGEGDGRSSAFGIKSSGEAVYLSDSLGHILDEVESPRQECNTSYSRREDGAGGWAVASCTPGEKNAAWESAPSPPVFSKRSGFYSQSFSLSLTSEEGHDIYYTLDASVPSVESNKYSGEILVENVSDRENIYSAVQRTVSDWKNDTPDPTPVDKAFVVRAIAADASGNCSEPSIGVYFVGMDGYKEKNVISLVADDPDDLFGEDGIYVTGKAYDRWYLGWQFGKNPVENFLKHGREFEALGTLHWFQSRLELEQKVGMRIQGSSSRLGRKKRFNVFARKEYSGERYFKKGFFGDKKTHSVTLRDSFANVLCQELVKDRAAAVQSAIPVTVFLNGELWYDAYLHERYDSRYLLNTYGVEKENVVMIGDGFLKEGNSEDYALYLKLYEFLATHDLSEPEAYREFTKMADVQSYIDFLCANLFLCNMDCSETKNYNIWRVREPGDGTYSDGRWRWMLYDMDNLEWNYLGLKKYRATKAAAINSFRRVMLTAGVSYRKHRIFAALRKNKEFQRQFVLTFLDLVNENFSKETVSEALLRYGKDLSWNGSFFALREKYIVPFMAKEFQLTGTLEELTLSVNDEDGGSVLVNTIQPTFRNGTWSGSYYTDYPVTVRAKAKAGYRFAGWVGSVSSKKEKLSVSLSEGGVQLQAVFEKKGKEDEKERQ